jgi:hypothetical protein
LDFAASIAPSRRAVPRWIPEGERDGGDSDGGPEHEPSVARLPGREEGLVEEAGGLVGVTLGQGRVGAVPEHQCGAPAKALTAQDWDRFIDQSDPGLDLATPSELVAGLGHGKGSPGLGAGRTVDRGRLTVGSGRAGCVAAVLAGNSEVVEGTAEDKQVRLLPGEGECLRCEGGGGIRLASPRRQDGRNVERSGPHGGWCVRSGETEFQPAAHFMEVRSLGPVFVSRSDQTHDLQPPSPLLEVSNRGTQIRQVGVKASHPTAFFAKVP